MIPRYILRKEGFTLIEILIYVAIFSVILFSMITFVFRVIEDRTKTIVDREVQQNTRFVLDRINETARNAIRIKVPSPNATSTALVLKMADPVLDPTRFELKGGVVWMKEGKRNARPLTTSQVTVTSLLFSNVSYAGTPGAVKTDLSLEYRNTTGRIEYDKSLTVVSNSVSLRGQGETVRHFIARAPGEQTKTSSGWSAVVGSAASGTIASPTGWLDDSNFIAGGKYLILIWGEHNTSDVNQRSGIRVTHGAIPFNESETVEETDQNSALYKTPYFWFTVWTAVAGEDINVEFFRSGNTARVEDITLLALHAEDLLQNGDLVYDIEISPVVPGPLTTSPVFTNTSSITWSPANNGDTWWIMGYSRADIFETGGDNYLARIAIDGAPRAQESIEGEDAADTPVYGLGWVSSFSNVPHTIVMQLAQTGPTQNWLASGVFALRLNTFRDFTFEANAGVGPVMSTPGTWVENANINATATAASTWVIAAGAVIDDNNTRVLTRLQEAESNITDDTGGWQHNTTDEIPNTLADVRENLLGGVYDFDYDAETTLAGSANAIDAWVLGFSMRLVP